MTKEYTPQQILALPMGDNDAGAKTIGQYFVLLAERCWIEEEAFEGKRPFGNSGWQHEVAHALIDNKVIGGSFDEDGYIEDYSDEQLEGIVTSLFKLLLGADWATLEEWKEPEDWYVVYLDLNENKEPNMADFCTKGLTESAAKMRAHAYNEDLTTNPWIAVHIRE